jgi:hypothetical protein
MTACRRCRPVPCALQTCCGPSRPWASPTTIPQSSRPLAPALAVAGVRCEVVAPSKLERRPGTRSRADAGHASGDAASRTRPGAWSTWVLRGWRGPLSDPVAVGLGPIPARSAPSVGSASGVFQLRLRPRRRGAAPRAPSVVCSMGRPAHRRAAGRRWPPRSSQAPFPVAGRGGLPPGRRQHEVVSTWPTTTDSTARSTVAAGPDRVINNEASAPTRLGADRRHLRLPTSRS